LIVQGDSVGLSDLTRVNGLNGKGGLVSVDNLGVGRFRNGNTGCVMMFGAGDVIAAVVVDDDAVAAGDGIVGDADADDAVGAVDDVADFDDNSGKFVVYYGDFDNNSDIDAPVDNYSLLACGAQEQALLWLFQGVGTLGALAS
jgi:hypothetical protein